MAFESVHEDESEEGLPMSTPSVICAHERITALANQVDLVMRYELHSWQGRPVR